MAQVKEVKARGNDTRQAGLGRLGWVGLWLEVETVGRTGGWEKEGRGK